MNAAAPHPGHLRLAGQTAATPVAYGPHGPVSAGRFAADALHLAARIEAAVPGRGHVLNICGDRYRFTVGLIAAILANRISLLPSSQTADTLRQMRDFAPDLFCLEDGTESTIQLSPEVPALTVADDSTPDPGGEASAFDALAAIPAERIAAYVFTSGSTGVPLPHRKTWGNMVRNAAAAMQQQGLTGNPHAIVATVPPQHMYGFESSVLLNLLGHCPVWRGRPFYPADIVAALAAVPQPRMLVTTPFHLRALLDSGVSVPPVERILSATAPLPQALAEEAEARLGAPLQEIYGCTETGQIATRRVTESPLWSLMPDIELRTASDTSDTTIASGGHIEGEIPLGDVIEQRPGRRFQLVGRHSELINIAGKRTTLGYLNQQLLSIAGVEDGCFHMPDDDGDQTTHVTRLCALVVAPTLNQAALLDALRQRIDAIFMPRPLILVEQLPRNATGKLPRAAIAAILAQHAAEVSARPAAQAAAPSAEQRAAQSPTNSRAKQP